MLVIYCLEGCLMCHSMLVFNIFMTQTPFVKSCNGKVGQGSVRGWVSLGDSSKTPWHCKRCRTFQNSGLTDAVLWKWSHVVPAELSSLWCLWVELRLQQRNQVVCRSVEQLWPLGYPQFGLTLGIMLGKAAVFKTRLKFPAERAIRG